MKLTRNFTREEFSRSATAQRQHIDNTIPYALMENVVAMATWLQVLRDRLNHHYGRKIYISILSGYRSPELNKAIGGSPNSYHMDGLAADIVASTLTPYELAMFIKKHMSDMPVDQCILEFDTWVHVGIHPEVKTRRKHFLEAFRTKDLFGRSRTRYKPLVPRNKHRNFSNGKWHEKEQV